LNKETANAYGSREHNRYDENDPVFTQEQEEQGEYDEEI
jgi:hypothetical protein